MFLFYTKGLSQQNPILPLLLVCLYQNTGICIISQITSEKVYDAHWGLFRCQWESCLWHSFHPTSNFNKHVPEQTDSIQQRSLNYTVTFIILCDFYKLIILLSLY